MEEQENIISHQQSENFDNQIHSNQNIPPVSPAPPAPPVMPSPDPSIPDRSNKKPHHYFRWGCSAIILVLIGLFWAFPAYRGWIWSRQFFHQKEAVSSDQIEADFATKKINEDQYVRQLAYLQWDKSKLDAKYQSKTKETTNPDVLIWAEKYADKLSAETLKIIGDNILPKNVRLGVSQKNSGNFGSKAYAASEESNVAGLDKVKVSSGKRFVIWYTSNGYHAVTDSEVNKIATDVDML
jgi:hypothetical protein